LRERSVEAAITKGVGRHIALVARTYTEEAVSRGCVCIREGFSKGIARLEAKPVGQPASNLNDSGVIPTSLAVIEDIAEAKRIRAGMDEVRRLRGLELCPWRSNDAHRVSA